MVKIKQPKTAITNSLKYLLGKCTGKNLGTVPQTAEDSGQILFLYFRRFKIPLPRKILHQEYQPTTCFNKAFQLPGEHSCRETEGGKIKKKILPESYLLLDDYVHKIYKKIVNYSNNTRKVRALHIIPLPLRFFFV